MSTALDIINDAFLAIGAFGPIDLPISNQDAQTGLRWLNKLIDSWNAQRKKVFNVTFSLFTLIPGKSPITIGPSGDFDVAQRPVDIQGASLVIPGAGSPVDLNIRTRDDAWWLNQTVKQIQTSVPTDLYYSPDWPNGSLYFWPVPNVAYQVRLEIWGLLSQIPSLSTSFSLPPGYDLAITYTLAEMLAKIYGYILSAEFKLEAVKARSVITANNDVPPRISSADYGTRGGNARRDFNYYSGTLPS